MLHLLGGAGHKMAGYKGYGYAAVVEIRCARFRTTAGERNLLTPTLTNGQRRHRPSLLGHFFIAIDVSAFTELSRFKEITGKICKGFVTATRIRQAPDRSTPQASPSIWHGRTAATLGAHRCQQSCSKGWLS